MVRHSRANPVIGTRAQLCVALDCFWVTPLIIDDTYQVNYFTIVAAAHLNTLYRHVFAANIRCWALQ